jgi:hypothetical protein
MPTYLQPAILPERCFLHEELMWVAFQRLPIASYIDEREIRETHEAFGGYAIEISDTRIFEEEAARAGIPPDPDLVAIYERLRATKDLDDDIRGNFAEDRAKHEQACQAWAPFYKRAIEYPSSQIFVALRSGSLRAMGRPLPSIDTDEALKLLSKDDRNIWEVEPIEIPASFWSLEGVSFDASTAKNQTMH